MAVNFPEVFFGGLSVYAVDHHLFGLDLFVGLYEGIDFFGGGIVYAMAVVLASKEHGLDNRLAFELFQGLNHTVYGEFRGVGAVNDAHGGFDGRVEFQDIVVHTAQSFHHFGVEDSC